MRLKLTILLLALNIALLGTIVYFDKVQSTRSSFEAASRLILNPDFVQNLDRIRISSSTIDNPWIIQQSGTNWIVSSPINWKANPFAVQQLLFQLRELSWESRFPVEDVRASGQSLSDYGLENPSIQIALTNGEVTLNLALGAPTEIGKRLYLMSPDGEFVFVVSRTLLDVLHRDLEAFLDRRVFGMSARGIWAIQIQDRSASNVRVRLERDDGGWNFVSPIATAADPNRVEEMIQNWQSLEVENFEGSPNGLESLNGDAMRLTFEGLGHRETLILAPQEVEGNRNFLARREAYPAVFRIESAIVEELKRVQDRLRERQILSKYSTGWTSLEIHFDAISVTLQQLENGDWQVLHTGENEEIRYLPASRDAVGELENLLKNMEAVRFVSDAPSEIDLSRFGLDEPQRRLLLRMPKGNNVELLIGGLSPESTETLLYAKTNLSNSVFLIRPWVLASLPLNPLHYREKVIRSLPETAVVEDIRLIDREENTSLLEENRGELEETRQILRAYLRNTKFEKFLDREFSDPLQLDESRSIGWPYSLEGKVLYQTSAGSEPETMQLFISQRLGGNTQYVGDPESGLVGILPPELIETLDPLLAEFPEEPSPESQISEPPPTPDPVTEP